MKKMEIFDPAMYCPTGVCGPSVDKNLLRVATQEHDDELSSKIYDKQQETKEKVEELINKVKNNEI